MNFRPLHDRDVTRRITESRLEWQSVVLNDRTTWRARCPQDIRKNLEMRNGFDPYSSSELGITAPQVKPTGRAANDISDSVIDISSIIARGHSKIIGHYRQLLNRDLTPAERADIEARIAREEHAWFGQQFSFNPRRQKSQISAAR